jgi:AAA domain-containing protein/bifunctional DNA primase/polymerase-like protein
MATNGNGGLDILEHLYDQLGKVVILPIPLGKKGPVFKGWQDVTYEDTQTEQYQRALKEAIKRGGNLGVLLGEASNGLRTIDFDDQADAEEFVAKHGWAKNAFTTRGAHGCQIWFRMPDGPEKRVILKKIEDKPTLEFRGGGGIQSIVGFGLHPEGMRYQIVVDQAAAEIPYGEIREWIDRFQFYKQNGDHDYSWLARFPGCNIRELDLVGLLREVGIICRETSVRDKYAIRCPWHEEHTMNGGELDAVIWQWGRDRWPSFHCLHAHCEGRTLEHLLLKIDDAKLVKKYCRPVKNTKLPPQVTYDDIITEEPKLPRQIIVGMLHQGLKMMIAGPPKMRKSWLATDLALSLSLGGIWIGFDTVSTKVLYLNMEMLKAGFDWRLYQVQKTRGITKMAKGNFNAIHLRGSMALTDNWDELAKLVRQEGYEVIIVDPIYKCYGDKVENDAGDMAKLLHYVDQVAGEDASVILVHHFAKGNSFDKDVGDRASGSGVFYRDADVFTTISWADPKLKMMDEGRIDVRARMVAPIAPIGVRWIPYGWQRDPTIDVQAKTVTNSVRDDAGDILKILKSSGKGLLPGEWWNRVMVSLKISRATFYRIVKELKAAKKIRNEGKKWVVVSKVVS